MLLREMQIQNPTAVMIARTAVAQDDITGYVIMHFCVTPICDTPSHHCIYVGPPQGWHHIDGGAHWRSHATSRALPGRRPASPPPCRCTLSWVVVPSVVSKQPYSHTTPLSYTPPHSHTHHPTLTHTTPRSYTPPHHAPQQGFEAAKRATLEFLETFKQQVDPADREKLACVARTSLRTKVYADLADLLTDIVTDAVLTIQKPGEAIDLHMVEIMHMKHKLDRDTRLIKGLVLDHGSRHPDMPKRLENAFILTGNISLEYDKSEINSGFFYSNAEQREAMVVAERAVIDDKVNKIIELKRKVGWGWGNG